MKNKNETYYTKLWCRSNVQNVSLNGKYSSKTQLLTHILETQVKKLSETNS